MQQTIDGRCGLNAAVEKRRCCDDGFMGYTHVLSSVAVFLVAVAFIPSTMYSLLGTSSAWILILAAINVSGSSLTPDLDNSASTSKSSLGILGDLLSVAFRTSSEFIQLTIRTGRDDATPNPHRGFYHTFLCAGLIGVASWWLCSSNFFQVDIPMVKSSTSGTLFAIVFSWLNLHMALAGLAKSTMKKIKKGDGPFGEIIAFALSLGIVLAVFSSLPAKVDYGWIGVSITAGMMIHMIGDCFTAAGCPVLFPLPRKGKLWFTYRLIGIKTGGVIESTVFTAAFTLAIAIAILKIVGLS